MSVCLAMCVEIQYCSWPLPMAQTPSFFQWVSFPASVLSAAPANQVGG